MPNVNTINFGGLSNADMQAQQMELARRQKMVDMLREQSNAPLEGQMVSGRAVPISGIQSISKFAQALMGNYLQSGLDQKQAALGEAARARSVDALKSLAPTGTFEGTAASTDPNGLGITADSGEPAPKADQATRDRWAKILAANTVDPQLARDLIKNELNMTDEQKNLLAQGVDPKAYGAARLAKEQAGGVTNVAAGTSVFNPSQGRFVAAAPDFGAGIQGGFSPSGQAQMGKIQGAEIIPQMAGEKARQEAAGKAGFNTITVNTPNGPVLMTEEQAAQMAGGGRPMMPNPQAPVNFNASNGVSINLSGKTPQQIIQAAQASGDPQVMQAVGEWMNSGQQQPPQIGIPLQSEAQKALQVGQAQNAVELAKDLAKNAQSPEAQQKIADAQSVVGLLQEASPYINTATGSTAGSIRDSALGLIGRSTEAGRDSARLAAIGGQLVSKMPKMSGPQSDKDVQLYKEMAGRIGDPSVPSDVKQAAAETIMRLNQKYLQQNIGSLPSKALETVRSGGSAPSMDDLLKKYGGGR